MKVSVTILFSVFLYQVSAYRIWDWNLFSEETSISAVSEITEECIRLAGWGQCSFYDCLEDRFPCGDEGYTKKISKHFCTKIDQSFNEFDAFGQLWLNRTSICLLGYMLPIYQQDSTTCEDIKAAGIQAILNCNDATVEGRNFCDFLNTNGEHYSNLMGREEVLLMASLRNPRVFTSMVSDAIQCGVGNLADTLRDIGHRVLRSFFSWFD